MGFIKDFLDAINVPKTMRQINAYAMKKYGKCLDDLTEEEYRDVKKHVGDAIEMDVDEKKSKITDEVKDMGNEYLCQGCKNKTNRAYMCDRCKTILCNGCKRTSTCCQNEKGKAGCNGSYRDLP